MSRTLAIAAALSLAAILAMAASEAEARCVTAGAVTECKLAESVGKVGDQRLLKRFGRDDAKPTFRVVVEWAPSDPGCLPGDSSCQAVERCNLYVEIHERDHAEPWVHFVALLVPGHNSKRRVQQHGHSEEPGSLDRGRARQPLHAQLLLGRHPGALCRARRAVFLVRAGTALNAKPAAGCQVSRWIID